MIAAFLLLIICLFALGLTLGPFFEALSRWLKGIK